MIENLQAHPSMPAPYVEFVRQLWRTQTEESQHTWARQRVAARLPIFAALLASKKLGTELRRVYEIPVGPQIAEALTEQAVYVPGLWMSEDKRTKKEQASQFKEFRTAMNKVSALLDQDRSMPDAQVARGKSAAESHQAKRAPRNKFDAIARRPIPLAFENVFSEPLVVGRWRGWIAPEVPDLKGIKLRLSLYEFHHILRSFDKPLGKTIEDIKKFRTYAVDDPLLKHMGQITKGTPWIRHAALLLDESIDQFSDDFTRWKGKLSRDKLVSAFVMAIYPNNEKVVADYKAINRICRPRRN